MDRRVLVPILVAIAAGGLALRLPDLMRRSVGLA
jgi:hypothetical protein